jgi:hypothetical protein
MNKTPIKDFSKCSLGIKVEKNKNSLNKYL